MFLFSFRCFIELRRVESNLERKRFEAVEGRLPGKIERRMI